MSDWKDRVILTQDDITVQEVDVIVNAANEGLAPGGGVCGAIHAAAGPALAEECAEIGHCGTGEAVATGAHDLPAEHVIHTVGPVWGGGAGLVEEELLASCYRESLDLCAELGGESIAFPSISTGTYAFPVDRAAPIAMEAIRDGLNDHGEIREVRMVCFSAVDLEAYEAAFAKLR